MKNILIAGATGMIGNEILQLCLQSNQVQQVVCLVRKPLPFTHPKLNQLICADYTLLQPSTHPLPCKIDVAFYCVGVYTGTVSTAILQQVTVTYTELFVDWLQAQQPNVVLSFLSGQGADTSETSKVPFAKFKGMAENYITNSGLAHCLIFRPGYIYPVKKRKEPNLMYSLLRWLYPLLKFGMKKYATTSQQLSQAMFSTSFTHTGKQVFENQAINEIEAEVGG